MIIPAFALTYQEQVYLIKEKIIIKDSTSNFTKIPVKYFYIDEKKEQEFFNHISIIKEDEKKETNRSFVIKMVSFIFTLMRHTSTVTDSLTLCNIIISLYQISPEYSERLLSLVRVNAAHLTKIDFDKKFTGIENQIKAIKK